MSQFDDLPLYQQLGVEGASVLEAINSHVDSQAIMADIDTLSENRDMVDRTVIRFLGKALVTISMARCNLGEPLEVAGADQRKTLVMDSMSDLKSATAAAANDISKLPEAVEAARKAENVGFHFNKEA